MEAYMVREDALKGFKEESQYLLGESLAKREQAVNEEIGWLYDKVLEGMKRLSQMIIKTQNADEDYLIKFFQISLLRTPVTENRVLFELSAYNEEYFLDKKIKAVIIDGTKVFEPLITLKEQLLILAKKYDGRIFACDIERQIAACAFDVNRELAERFRYLLWDFDEHEFIQGIKKNHLFLVKWGGHWEQSETIFLGDESIKNQNLFEEKNELNTIETINYDYVFNSWDKVSFENLVMTEKQLLFQSFRYCNFVRCAIGGSILVGSNFRGSMMNRSAFVSCNFCKCNFKQMQLEDVHFIQCDLANADFRDTVFSEVTFGDSSLAGALFSRKDIAFLHLSDRQMQEIIVG